MSYSTGFLKACSHYISVTFQDSRTRDETLCREERSKVVAGTRYENHRRGHDQSLKSRQEALHAKYTQGVHQLATLRVIMMKSGYIFRHCAPNHGIPYSKVYNILLD